MTPEQMPLGPQPQVEVQPQSLVVLDKERLLGTLGRLHMVYGALTQLSNFEMLQPQATEEALIRRRLLDQVMVGLQEVGGRVHDAIAAVAPQIPQ